MSHFQAHFSWKRPNFLGNEHFSGKFLKKSAIFCTFSKWTSIMSYFWGIFWAKSANLLYFEHFFRIFPKKSAIFCTSAIARPHLNVGLYVLFFRQKSGKKAEFPRKWALLGSKLEKKCNFLHIRFRPICAIFSRKFRQKPRIS